MKINNLEVNKLDQNVMIKINGEPVDDVIDYEIMSSAHGRTELILKINIDNTKTTIETLTSRKGRSS